MKKKIFLFFLFILIASIARPQCTGSVGTPIINETFGSGTNTYGPQLPAGVTNMQYIQSTCPEDGQYSIVNYTSGCYGAWHTVTDAAGEPNGYYMLINASYAPSDFFLQTVNGLCEGTTYEFSSEIMNLDPPTGGILPNITFTIEKTDGTILSTYSTGNVPGTNTAQWVKYGFFFKTPVGVSTVVVRMHNNADGGGGNDLALDDIAFTPAGPQTIIGVTGTNSSIVHTFCNNKTSFFSTVASCYILNTYQWQISANGGTTWTDIPGATNAGYTINIAATGTYLYRLAVAENGNIGNVNCRTNSNVVTLMYDPPASANISASICSGSSYLLPSGKSVNTAGIFKDIALSKQGCDSLITMLNLTVNALPAVDGVANQSLDNGTATTAVNFTGTANTFTWVNDTPGIGLAASGTGNIASFTAVNTGSSPVTATITATPLNAGLAYVTNIGPNTVSVINTITNALIDTIAVGLGPYGVSVSPDSKLAYVANEGSNTVSAINTTTNAVVATIPVGAYPLGLSVSPDGSRLYVANGGLSSNSVSVINTATNLVIATIGVGTSPTGVSVSPDGSRVYVTNASSANVSVINTATNTVITTISVGSDPTGVCISPDGSLVYVANYYSNTVSVISTKTNTVITAIVVTEPGGITISPDGNRLYIANYSNTVSVINTATNAVIATIPVGIGPQAVSVSPDGGTVYVTNQLSNYVSAISTATNAVVSNIPIGSGSYSLGNFITQGVSCSGTPVTFTITVNSTVPTITTSTATGTISACVGSASASPNIQQFTVSGSFLKANITASAPTGFEVSLSAGSGYGSSVTLTQTAGTVNNTVVYVRSAASAPAGNISGQVVLNSAVAASLGVVVTGTVNPLVTPSVSIAASANNICAGSPVTFTATPVNGGSAPVYQWMVNGSPAGTNSATFSSSTLINGDMVTCVMTSNACVAPGNPTSNGITMNVTPQAVPSITIAVSANNICAGSGVTFIATPTNGGNAPVYQWMVNGNPAGTNSAAFSSSTLVNGDVVTCVITSNAACVAPANATSNSITMTVNSPVNPSVSIVASANNICFGTPVTFTATPTNGGGAPVYQWLVNGIYTEPDNTTATFTSSVLANSDIITCVMTSNATCVTPGNSTSNNIIMNVTATVAPSISIAASSNNICAGSPVTFTATPTNGGSAPVYRWMVNGNPGGTNSVTFSSSTFVNGDVVTCVMTSNATCAAPADATSNGITMNVTAQAIPSITIAVSANNICTGSGVTFIATPTNGGNAPAYQWMVNGSLAGTNSVTFSSSTLANGDVVTCVMTSNAACVTPADATSNSIAMTVNSQVNPSVSIAASANNICFGTPVTFTATPVNGGGAPVYQWMVNGSPAGTNSASFSSATLTNGDAVTCAMTSNANCVAPGNSTSNNITMNVTATVAPSISIATSANNICAGLPVTFTAAPTNGGSAPLYQWMVNGNPAGTNSITFSSSTLANGDAVTCVMTSNATCAAPANATSNLITMTVNSEISPSITIAASANNICIGSPVTFTATPTNGGNAPVFQWMVNGNPAGTNSATFSSTLANGDVVTCVMTSNAACVAPTDATSNSITMIVNSQVNPSVTIAASTNNICSGTPVTFTATPTNGGSAPVYQWLVNGINTEPDNTTATFTSSVLANGDIITCVMTGDGACVTPVSVTSNSITTNVNPSPIVDAGGNKTIDEGSGTILNATASGNITDITWTPSLGLSDDKILNPVASPTFTTTYTLTVETTDGCFGTGTAKVEVIIKNFVIPNTFTPNGDGINDTWNIKYLDTYPNCTVQIFSRWGENVYTSTGYSVPWDGTYKGSALPSGTYYYIINLKNGLNPLSGFVAIIR